MTLFRSRRFSPFASRGRRTLVATLLVFAISSALSVAVSIWATSRSQHRAAAIQIAGRQRTLSERYVQEVLLRHAGAEADPETTASLLRSSALVLLDGGRAPAVDGDDDETKVVRQNDPRVRAQLEQELSLVGDLTAAGEAYLHGRAFPAKLLAHEHLTVTDPAAIHDAGGGAVRVAGTFQPVVTAADAITLQPAG